MDGFKDESYRSNKTYSQLAVVGLSIILICEILQFVPLIGNFISPDSMLNFGEGEMVSTWIAIIGVVALVRIPVYIFTVVFFLMWLFRAYKNLNPLKSENAMYSPGWAVGWWFIPIASLFVPFRVMRELWNESDPDFDSESDFLTKSIAGAAPSIMIFWWAAWVIYNISGRISDRVFDDGTGRLTEGFILFFGISCITGIISAIMAALIVKQITKRQDLRFEKVGILRQEFQEPPSPPKFD